MPTITPVAIPLASITARSTLASAERLINAYVQVVGDGPAARPVIYRSPGLKTWSTAANLPCRGMIDIDRTTLLSLHGQTLYAYTTAGVGATWGTVPNSDRVTMATNAASPSQTCIVTGGRVYVASSGAVSLLTEPALPTNVVGVTWIDGYFVFALSDGRFFLSGLNDTTVNALDFATAESDPDGLVMAASLQRELYLFGPKTIEIWANAGSTGFPFQRLGGGVMPYGCSAPFSVTQVEQALYWVDEAGAVRRTAGGYQAEDISNVTTVEAIRKVENKADIVGFSYRFASDSFYVIRHSSFTLLYNTRTGFWHERATLGNDAWRANAMRFFAGRTVCGSALDGTLFEIDADTYDDGGTEIVSIIQTPRMDSAPLGAAVAELNIEMETGWGRDVPPITSTDTTNPQMTLRWSDDGAKTFNGGRMLPLGKKGEFTKRVRATRLGSFGEKGRVWRLEISSRVFSALLAMSARIEPLDR